MPDVTVASSYNYVITLLLLLHYSRDENINWGHQRDIKLRCLLLNYSAVTYKAFCECVVIFISIMLMKVASCPFR